MWDIFFLSLAHRLLIQTIARDPIHYGLHYYDYRAKKSIALIDMGQKETERIKAMTYDHMTACVFILK